MTPRRGARTFVLLLAAATALLLPAAPAAAHASLLSAEPGEGDVLDAAPERVRLTFSEPVELPTDGLRLLDADAQRVETAVVDDGDPATVTATLPELPDGGYVLSYRVVSADSHPVGGVLTFAVGGAGAVGDELLADLAGGGDDPVVAGLGQAVRGLGYVAALLAAGAVAFAGLVARDREDRRLARRVGLPAAASVAVLALVSLPLQAASVTGDGLAGATSATALADVLASSFGLAAVVRAIGAAVLTVLWSAGAPVGLVGLGGATLLGSFLLDGHQRTVEPTWLLTGADALHLAAGAVWFAGLVLVTLRLRRRAPGERPVDAARLVARFSGVALLAVAVVASAGVAMAVPLVGTPSALVGTTYGWLLVAKTAVVAVVVGLAAYNRRWLVPRVVDAGVPTGGSLDTRPDAATEGPTDPERAWRRLSTTVRLEAGALVGVLLLTGVLVTVQPASEEVGRGGWYAVTAKLGDELELDLVIDPNRAGRNTLHLYALDDTGRPAADVEDLRLELTYLDEGIGPIGVEPFLAGTGHWIATVDDLAFAGDWEVRVVAGLDRFDEVEVTVTVPVAP